MDVAVIGAGRVGTALAVRLRDAGYHIAALSGRDGTAGRAARYLPGVPIQAAPIAARGAEVVIIGTPDDLIEQTASSLAGGGALGVGQSVIHLSGATSLDALSAPRAAGAEVLSVHPLQTFPDVDAALARIPGSGIAVTALSEPGYVLGERLARDVGGRPFRLADEAKPLYHAAAVFASNYLVAIAALADELFRDAGLPEPAELFLPLQRATLDNVAAMGPAAALTGPAIRGDAGTVAANLEALAKHAPEAVPAYVALADVALRLAHRSGRLSTEARTAVEEVLDPWR
jgi:predicted short-subunit dehydrogenase-like oxidoreductase (DUF2520 family)